MLFIHPMWFHESQRLGQRACTPVGYALHGIAELIGFAGLLALLVAAIVVVWKGLLTASRADSSGFSRCRLASA